MSKQKVDIKIMASQAQVESVGHRFKNISVALKASQTISAALEQPSALRLGFELGFFLLRLSRRLFVFSAQRRVGDASQIIPATTKMRLVLDPDAHRYLTLRGGVIAFRLPWRSTLKMFDCGARSALGGGPVRTAPRGSTFAGKAGDAAGGGVFTGMLVPLMGDSYNGCLGMKLLLG